MERLGSSSPLPETVGLLYASWEEVNVSTDKGRREVHYYLKRIDGGSDLAVIGKERSLRHMSYYYAIRNRSLLLSLKPPLKLKSRREVIDWLTSVVSESVTRESPHGAHSLDGNNGSGLDFATLREGLSQKLGSYTKEFLWLGSSWTCRKRRKHYQSFRRNGVKISVYDFVFVLAEEDKRLIAYLEDMYEDSKGNNMVVVRWFHKIDEVGIVLPHNFNDREIFFSLCLQDLSIECIDGLATVLSPQHFEKFLREATHTKLVPFVCCKQFENEDIKPFDVTQVKGYWKQEIIRYMYSHPSRDQVNPQSSGDCLKVEGCVDASFIRPNKRHCRLEDADVCTGSKDPVETAHIDTLNLNSSQIVLKNGAEPCSQRGESSPFVATTESKQNYLQHLKVGSEVEVLSQDSGIRGCWFRAVIIKKHKEKVKVRYQDINDADDEAKKLEEWILASRLAVPDHLGLRICGRTIVRPAPQSISGQVSQVDIGTAVDVWWHDAWCEGIVFRKDSEDKIHVYFPGEKQELVFGCAHLRHSQEWLGDRWKHIKERPNILSSICSELETKQVTRDSNQVECPQGSLVGTMESGKSEGGLKHSLSGNGTDALNKLGEVPDLAKDGTLTQLRWRTSRKRRRGNSGKSSPENVGSNAIQRFLVPSTLKVDRENCKYIGDSLFSSAVVQPLTSLVLSRVVYCPMMHDLDASWSSRPLSNASLR